MTTGSTIFPPGGYDSQYGWSGPRFFQKSWNGEDNSSEDRISPNPYSCSIVSITDGMPEMFYHQKVSTPDREY